MYSIFIPVQPFISSTLLLPSSSAAIIGPNLIATEKVPSSAQFGSICKLLQLSMTSRSLNPKFQFAVRWRWLQCRRRIRKLVRPHSRILQIKIMISFVDVFFLLIYSICECIWCISYLIHHVIYLTGQTSNQSSIRRQSVLSRLAWWAESAWLKLEEDQLCQFPSFNCLCTKWMHSSWYLPLATPWQDWTSWNCTWYTV